MSRGQGHLSPSGRRRVHSLYESESQVYNRSEGSTNLSVSRAVVPLCVQIEELLSQFHLQVIVHRAVVIAWTAGLQGVHEVRVGKGGSTEKRGQTVTA